MPTPAAQLLLESAIKDLGRIKTNSELALFGYLLDMALIEAHNQLRDESLTCRHAGDAMPLRGFARLTRIGLEMVRRRSESAWRGIPRSQFCRPATHDAGLLRSFVIEGLSVETISSLRRNGPDMVSE
jgi:hypothetical protein